VSDEGDSAAQGVLDQVAGQVALGAGDTCGGPGGVGVERDDNAAVAVVLTLDELTPRETEILRLVGNGLSNDQIAGPWC
jgi:DNA-binding NarL/FixJ family response regulator